MNITITTSSGINITQPEQKWMVALLIALCEHDQELYLRVCQLADCEPTKVVQALVMAFAAKKPDVFLQICELVDTKVDAYASIPDSVQKSLRN